MTENTQAMTASPTGTRRRFTPSAGTRVQLVSAALMWMIGATILLVRGVGFLHDSWFAALVALAVTIGVVKSRFLLDNIARKAVERIRQRGVACYFGFFSPRSWGFIAVMMGGGILLRSSGLPKDLLAVIYVAVGSALVLADRIFWQAVVAPAPAPQEG